MGSKAKRNEVPTDEEYLKLSPSQRAVLFAWRNGVRNYQEMAWSLGVRVGTIKSRLHRAREALIKLRETQQ
jgi:DNA-directed RNA polymerase specialized sigma24 family protein